MSSIVPIYSPSTEALSSNTFKYEFIIWTKLGTSFLISANFSLLTTATDERLYCWIFPSSFPSAYNAKFSADEFPFKSPDKSLYLFKSTCVSKIPTTLYFDFPIAISFPTKSL